MEVKKLRCMDLAGQSFLGISLNVPVLGSNEDVVQNYFEAALKQLRDHTRFCKGAASIPRQDAYKTKSFHRHKPDLVDHAKIVLESFPSHHLVSARSEVRAALHQMKSGTLLSSSGCQKSITYEHMPIGIRRISCQMREKCVQFCQLFLWEESGRGEMSR